MPVTCHGHRQAWRKPGSMIYLKNRISASAGMTIFLGVWAVIELRTTRTHEFPIRFPSAGCGGGPPNPPTPGNNHAPRLNHATEPALGRGADQGCPAHMSVERPISNQKPN
jgi:hypothetical protein